MKNWCLWATILSTMDSILGILSRLVLYVKFRCITASGHYLLTLSDTLYLTAFLSVGVQGSVGQWQAEELRSPC